MRNQTLIWTALPNGRPANVEVPTNWLALSVFVSPRLSTDEGRPGDSEPALAFFPDFVNWPQTIANVKFTVTFAGGVTLPATIANSYAGMALPPDPTRWPLVFDPARTGVVAYNPTNWGSLPAHSFSVHQTLASLQQIYTNFGANSPTAPPVMSWDGTGTQGRLISGQGAAGALQAIENVTNGRPNAIAQAAGYYNRPTPSPDDVPWASTVPTLDFHTAISALGSYPVLLRLFGLVFDLIVPNPPNFTSGYSTVSVKPTWTSSFTGANNWTTVNVSPKTQCWLTTLPGQTVSTFLPRPRSGVDYQNGMLDLADTTRFSVSELDVDGAAQQIAAFSQVLGEVNTYQESIGPLAAHQSMGVTPPSLRSTGPALSWSGWANQLQKLATQSWNNNGNLKNYLAGQAAALPVFYTEDIVRGYRFDVYTASEASPQWLSLHQRSGLYGFGEVADCLAPDAVNLPVSALDEGFAVPGVSQVAGVANPSNDVWMHEEIVRWSGWSLSCPRAGGRIDIDDTAQEDNGNPNAPTSVPGQVPDADGNITPQMTATFMAPYGTLPKLRFGNQYQFRARATDLAGNGLPVTTADASTATAPFTHYRYQPVAPPFVAPTSSLTPGQGVFVVALLNYSDGSVIEPTGRWLMPPRVSELLAEEHGMFDGFVLGSAPNPADGPDGSPATYNFISGADANTPSGAAGMMLDSVAGSPYFPTDPNNPFASVPSTTWLADPLSAGVALVGLPGETAGTPFEVSWGTQPWPNLNPILLLLEPGSTPSTAFIANSLQTPNATALAATVPPASVFDVQVSSQLTSPATLGIWQWILSSPLLASSTAQQTFLVNALAGQLWTLTPYHTIRLVHAVRLPLFGPHFGGPQAVTRPYGATTANIYDIKFFVDAPSTSSVDVSATWTDPVDDPTNYNNDPDRDTVTTTANAFKLTVPDPDPPAANDEPGTVVPALETFALFNKPGATHDIGDTKFHMVTYQATGTSRFAEFFRSYPPASIVASTTPIQLSNKDLGLDPGSLQIVDVNNDDVPDTEYTVDPAGGTITFNADSTYLGQSLDVSWIPTITSEGAPTTIPILASARPAPPKVLKVAPAWEILGPEGSLATHIAYGRAGGYLRVYLDRPWWSSGANELLGVVTLPRALQTNTPPLDPPARLGTVLGLDPISLADPSLHFSTTPQFLGGVTTLPTSIPGRSGYTNPAHIALSEDPSGTLYNIYPYEVNYDYTTNQWYADIQFKFPGGADVPPPGYFIRLALVRFQPYAWPGAEVSPVTLATFAQPVSDRAVVVTQVPKTNMVKVSVAGPGYEGFRPVVGPAADAPPGKTDFDYENPFAPDPYSLAPPNAPTTSTMVADWQVQNLDTGLPGELAWTFDDSVPPVVLQPTFNGGIVTWTGETEIPFPVGGSTPMRLRISEIDYYQGGSTAPVIVDTTMRRPFICHIPI
jgi:hypothetical protein